MAKRRSASDLLSNHQNRPWPLPHQPWMMTQSWDTLLFAHWPFSPELLEGLLPPGLQLDTWEGKAWVSVVPFQMGYRLRFSPFASSFGELNIRTYVLKDGKPGVFFFSLDACDSLTVVASRSLFGLPYHYSWSHCDKLASGDIIHSSQREFCGIGADGRFNSFEAVYRPTSEVRLAQPGTLEYWLTERYCLYSCIGTSNLIRMDVHHAPWPLQEASADIHINTMILPGKLEFPDIKPLLHYSAALDIIVWSPTFV